MWFREVTWRRLASSTEWLADSAKWEPPFSEDWHQDGNKLFSGLVWLQKVQRWETGPAENSRPLSFLDTRCSGVWLRGPGWGLRPWKQQVLLIAYPPPTHQVQAADRPWARPSLYTVVCTQGWFCGHVTCAVTWGPTCGRAQCSVSCSVATTILWNECWQIKKRRQSLCVLMWKELQDIFEEKKWSYRTIRELWLYL